MLKLGFVSAILANRSFEELISFAANHNFSCVEVMCWPVGKAERRYAGVTHIDIDQLDDAEISKIQNILKQNQIFISGLGYYPNPLDPDPEKRDTYFDHIKKLIVGARKLNVPVVNTFVGRDPSKNVTDNLKMFEERWPEIVDTAQENQVIDFPLNTLSTWVPYPGSFTRIRTVLPETSTP